MKKHLKRLFAPGSWPIKRKGIKFIVRPVPGPHQLKESMPLSLIFKDLLNIGETTREIKKILSSGKILVDNIPRKEIRFPVGIMDVIAIPETKQYFRILYDKNGKFIAHKISKEESEIKPRKIINKTILKGNKIQLNLYDGTNIIVAKDEYKVGDSLILSGNKIKEVISLEKNCIIYLTGGKHVSNIGILEGIHRLPGSQPNKVIFKINDQTFETLRKYAFVIGKTKPIITLP